MLAQSTLLPAVASDEEPFHLSSAATDAQSPAELVADNSQSSPRHPLSTFTHFRSVPRLTATLWTESSRSQDRHGKVFLARSDEAPGLTRMHKAGSGDCPGELGATVRWLLGLLKGQAESLGGARRVGLSECTGLIASSSRRIWERLATGNWQLAAGDRASGWEADRARGAPGLNDGGRGKTGTKSKPGSQGFRPPDCWRAAAPHLRSDRRSRFALSFASDLTGARGLPSRRGGPAPLRARAIAQA